MTHPRLTTAADVLHPDYRTRTQRCIPCGAVLPLRPGALSEHLRECPSDEAHRARAEAAAEEAADWRRDGC